MFFVVIVCLCCVACLTSSSSPEIVDIQWALRDDSGIDLISTPKLKFGDYLLVATNVYGKKREVANPNLNSIVVRSPNGTARFEQSSDGRFTVRMKRPRLETLKNEGMILKVSIWVARQTGYMRNYSWPVYLNSIWFPSVMAAGSAGRSGAPGQNGMRGSNGKTVTIYVTRFDIDRYVGSDEQVANDYLIALVLVDGVPSIIYGNPNKQGVYIDVSGGAGGNGGAGTDGASSTGGGNAGSGGSSGYVDVYYCSTEIRKLIKVRSDAGEGGISGKHGVETGGDLLSGIASLLPRRKGNHGGIGRTEYHQLSLPDMKLILARHLDQTALACVIE